MFGGIILVGISLLWWGITGPRTQEVVEMTGRGPLYATYTIENRTFTLVNGKAEESSAPGSASMSKVSIFGEPVVGDIDGNGSVDAVMYLTEDSGGSGTFYYLAAALNENGEYKGTNAIFLGDRIAPQNIQIKNGLVLANYAERNPTDPMTASPSVGVTRYAFISLDTLSAIPPLEKGEMVLSGNVVMGHEARTFTPCGETSYWVIGTSTAYKALMDTYNAQTGEPRTFLPVFATIVGRIVPAPTDGFGADYTNAILVRSLVQTNSGMSCEGVIKNK